MRNEQPIWKYIGYVVILTFAGAGLVGLITFAIVQPFYMFFGAGWYSLLVGIFYGFGAMFIALPLTLLTSIVNAIAIAMTKTRQLQYKQMLYRCTCLSIVVLSYIYTFISLFINTRLSATFTDSLIKLSIGGGVAIGICLANKFAINRLFWFEDESKKKRS